jgi:hypothetical protein
MSHRDSDVTDVAAAGRKFTGCWRTLLAGPGQLRTPSGPYYQGMTSRSRFTLDEARAAGERIGVD